MPGDLRRREPGWICPHCHEPRPASGHDPCIAGLSGVRFACCGHGRERGYIFFLSGQVLRFWPIEVAYTDADEEVEVGTRRPPMDVKPKLSFPRQRRRAK